MNPREELVTEDLERQGFEVINIEPPVFLLNKIDSPSDLAREFTKNLEKLSFKSGAPDLLAYKTEGSGNELEIVDYFFVEVKDKNDSLKTNQIRWISKSHETVFVAIVWRDIEYFYAEFGTIFKRK